MTRFFNEKKKRVKRNVTPKQQYINFDMRKIGKLVGWRVGWGAL